MSKLNTYTIKGTKKKTGIDLPQDMTEKVNMRLLAQAIRVYENRRHPGLSQAKTRADVTASKKKIYRQKGTGRARHGKISAPIFVGGGKAHGPDGLKRVLTMPKQMRDKAFKMAVSLKAKDGKMIIVEGISDIKKTKDAAALLKNISETEKINPKSNFLFALANKNKDAVLYLRNLENVSTVPFESLNAYNIFFSKIVIIDKEALDEKESKNNKNTKENKKEKKTSKSATKSKKTTKSKKGKEKSAK